MPFSEKKKAFFIFVTDTCRDVCAVNKQGVSSGNINRTKTD